MEFFNSAVDVLQTLVIALGAGLGIWGVVNLLEGYGQDNPASKGQGAGRKGGPPFRRPQASRARRAARGPAGPSGTVPSPVSQV